MFHNCRLHQCENDGQSFKPNCTIVSADCTTSNIPLQRAAFVTKNRRLRRWLALLLASDCGRRLQAIIMVSFGAQSDLQRRTISRLFSPSQRAIACARAPAASRPP